MIGTALAVLSIVAPVFVCAGVGFLWSRSGRAYDRALMTGLISRVGAPCLVFSNLVSLDIERGAMLALSSAAVASLALFAVVGWGALRALRLPTATFLAPVIFGNAGNMGIAICRFAYPGGPGETSPGLTLGICYFAVASLLHFTLGSAIWAGRLDLREVLTMPLTWAVALAVGVLALDLSPPRWLIDSTLLLGDFSIPLMLLTLGVSLSELRVQSLGRALAVAMLRLGIGSAVGFALAAALDLEGVVRGVLILQCSMPAAVFNYLFAEQYGRDPDAVASVVVLSTLLAFVTVPALLAFLVI